MAEYVAKHAANKRPANPAVKETFDIEAAKARKARKAAKMEEEKREKARVAKLAVAPTWTKTQHVVPKSWEDLDDENEDGQTVVISAATKSEEPVAKAVSPSIKTEDIRAPGADVQADRMAALLKNGSYPGIRASICKALSLAGAAADARRELKEEKKLEEMEQQLATKFEAYNAGRSARTFVASLPTVSSRAAATHLAFNRRPPVGFGWKKRLLATTRVLRRSDASVSSRASSNALGSSQVSVVGGGPPDDDDDESDSDSDYDTGSEGSYDSVERGWIEGEDENDEEEDEEFEEEDREQPSARTRFNWCCGWSRSNGEEDSEEFDEDGVPQRDDEQDTSHHLPAQGNRVEDKLQPLLKHNYTEVRHSFVSWKMIAIVAIIGIVIFAGLPLFVVAVENGYLGANELWETANERIERAKWTLENNRRLCPNGFGQLRPDGSRVWNPLCVGKHPFESMADPVRVLVKDHLAPGLFNVWEAANNAMWGEKETEVEMAWRILAGAEVSGIKEGYEWAFELAKWLRSCGFEVWYFCFCIYLAIFSWFLLLKVYEVCDLIWFYQRVKADLIYTATTEIDLRAAIHRATPLTEAARLAWVTIEEGYRSWIVRFLTCNPRFKRRLRVEIGLLMTMLAPQNDIRTLSEADQMKRTEDTKKTGALQAVPHWENASDYGAQTKDAADYIIRMRVRVDKWWKSVRGSDFPQGQR